MAALVVGAHSAAVNASTVFVPTDGTVNFLNVSLDVTGSKKLAIFDDTDTSFSFGSATVLNSTLNSASLAVFTGASPTNVDVKLASATPVLFNTSLSGDDKFILGYYDGFNWSGDTGYQYVGGDIYKVTFSGGQTFEIDVAVVPVPAAAWLFGTGLVGLIGVARRKAA